MNAALADESQIQMNEIYQIKNKTHNGRKRMV